MTSNSLDSLRSRSRGVSLGLFAADLGDLRDSARQACDWGCGILHFDIMDGQFVPQLTAGAGFVKALETRAVLDVHLMVQRPAEQVASFVAAGADIITIHAESDGAAQAIENTRKAAKDAGRTVLVGVGVMPQTELGDIQHLLDLGPDMILVLAVDPRTSNPPDISTACAKLEGLRKHFGPEGPLLAFDGGVTLKCIDEISACSPDMIVSGSAVFGADNPQDVFKRMAQAVQ